MKISTCYVLLAISLTSTVAASPLVTNSGLHRRLIPEQVTAQQSGEKAWAVLEKKLKDKTADVNLLEFYQKLYHVDYLKLSTAEVGHAGGDETTMVSQTPFKRGPPANSGAAAIFGTLPAIFPGISTAKDYDLVALSSMPRGTTKNPTPPPFKFNSVAIAYENYYDAKNGVIVAASNFQKADKNIKPGKTAKITLSSLFYYTYQAAAEREKTDVKNLKYMVRWEIKSTQTGPILTEIHKGEPAGTWLVWTPQRTPNTFLQLLGSDNGRSVAFMLADFSQAFGEKTICAVLTNAQLKVMVWVFSTGTPSRCPAAYQNDSAKKIKLGADPLKRKASASPPRSPGSNPNKKKPSVSRPGSPSNPNKKPSVSRPGSPAPQ